jgi:hypothetical protein
MMEDIGSVPPANDGAGYQGPAMADIAQFIRQQIQEAVRELQPRPQSTRNVKPAKPKTYDGSRFTDPDTWLFQFEQYANIVGLTNTEKVQLAATYLEGPAATWWESIYREAEQRAANEELNLPTWTEFKQILVATFKPVNSSKMARDKLATLKQKTSVTAYNAEFMQLCIRAGNVSEAEKLDRYVRGLKTKVRMEVELWEPRTLQQAMTLAQRVDSITWRMEQNSFSNNRSPNFAQNVQQHVPMDLGTVQSEPDGIGPQTDQLYAMNRTTSHKRFAPQMSREEFERCRQNGLCLKCKMAGHIARFCTATPENVKSRGKEIAR